MGGADPALDRADMRRILGSGVAAVPDGGSPMTVNRPGCAWLLVLVLALAAGRPTTAVAASANAVALSDAAKAGNWTRVRSLVGGGLRGEDVNASDSDGTRALHWAVRANELEVASLLLKAGADAAARNRLGLTPLYLAAANGNGPMIRALLEHGADANHVEQSGETMLMVATRSGSADAVRALLERGVNPNIAAPQLQLTALMIAAEAGATDAVRVLLQHKADIHARTRAGAVPARRMPCEIGRASCR